VASWSTFFGKEVSRELIGVLRSQDFNHLGTAFTAGGSPYTYVTTKTFLSHFGFDTLRDLPDFEALQDAGLLSMESCWLAIFRSGWWAGRVAMMKIVTGCRLLTRLSDERNAVAVEQVGSKDDQTGDAIKFAHPCHNVI
jgi:hypothetical protein